MLLNNKLVCGWRCVLGKFSSAPTHVHTWNMRCPAITKELQNHQIYMDSKAFSGISAPRETKEWTGSGVHKRRHKQEMQYLQAIGRKRTNLPVFLSETFYGLACFRSTASRNNLSVHQRAYSCSAIKYLAQNEQYGTTITKSKRMCDRTLPLLCRFHSIFTARKLVKFCKLSQKSASIKGEYHNHSIVVPGKVSKYRPVPDYIEKPPYVKNFGLSNLRSATEQIKNEKQIEGMRNSGAVACAILKYAGILVKPGVTTDEIDAKVHDMIIKQNAYPSPLLYKGFPKSICTSVNNIACHGIPDDRELKEGDIITIDVTVYYGGFHGDCSDTFVVGQVDAEAELLIEATVACRDEAIAQCGPGVPISTIGNTISDVAESLEYGISRDMVGHGIGENFHEYPNIYHFRNNEPGIMQQGMTFTIEPILCEGSSEMRLLSDEWSMATVDNSRTAQCEHTILITSNGAEILTAFDGDR